MSAKLTLLAVVATASVGCDAPAATRDPTTPITPLPLTDLILEAAPGHEERVGPGRGPILLHFWATWCVPCRRELPALLEADRAERGVTLIAVSDESWDDLDAYFGGQIPDPIARAPDRRLSRTLGVRTLPETYLLDDELVARRRAAGPVDWADPGVRSWLSEVGDASP